MKKDYLNINGQMVIAKDGFIEIDGKRISEKDEILKNFELSGTCIENMRAVGDTIYFNSIRVKRGSSARFDNLGSSTDLTKLVDTKLTKKIADSHLN
jgi:hypothetical protein